MQLRREVLEQADFGQLAKRALRRARAQDLVELLEQPRRRGLRDQRRVPANRVDDRRIDREVEPRGQHDRAQHPHRIFLEPHVRDRRSSGSTRALQILEAAGVVDDRERRDVVEQRVDGEVAAERVLFRRAERVVAVERSVAVAPPGLGGSVLLRGSAPAASCSASSCSLQLPPERRDLDGLRAEPHVRQPEAPADDPAVAEQPLDLVRMRRGADVEVFRPAAEQQVAHAAAHQIGDVVDLAEPVSTLSASGSICAARNRVLGARKDGRRSPCDRNAFYQTGRGCRLISSLYLNQLRVD